MERATGIEPASEAWEASILPMNYARNSASRRNRPVDHSLTADGRATGAPDSRADVSAVLLRTPCPRRRAARPRRSAPSPLPCSPPRLGPRRSAPSPPPQCPAAHAAAQPVPATVPRRPRHSAARPRRSAARPRLGPRRSAPSPPPQCPAASAADTLRIV